MCCNEVFVRTIIGSILYIPMTSTW